MKFCLGWSSSRISRLSEKASLSVSRKQPDRLVTFLGSITLWFTLSCSLIPSVSAAERLILRLGSFQRSVAVNDLEEFAQTGKLSPQLQPYAFLLTPEVRQILNRRLHIDPLMAEQFLDELFQSAQGEELMEQLKTALPESTTEQLKQALNQTLWEPEDLSILSFLRAYPRENLTVDVTAAASLTAQLNAPFLQSQLISPRLERDLKVEGEIAFAASSDPTELGDETVYTETLRLRDTSRKRTIPVDIYYSAKPRGPLIVMSHGFAADRKFLQYLAYHLASYGFTVASLEHPGSNVTSLNQQAAGINLGDILPASEFIDRPKDVSFLLDELEKINRQNGHLQGKFKTQQVIVIGHSFGSYTALALAGAELNLKELRNFCQSLTPLGRSPADWLQCAAAALPYSTIQFEDSRVAQVIAFNPIIGHLFGKSLSQVSLPTLILSSSADAVTPIIPHQLQPFKQLQGEKYLLMVLGATHMSVTDLSTSNSAMGQSTLVKEVMGKEAEPVRRMVRGISLAFIEQLTPEAENYQSFLSPAYVQSFSTPKITMRLATGLPTSLDVWLNVLFLGNQQLTLRKAKQTRSLSLMAKVKDYFVKARNILPHPGYSTAQLEQMFTDLLNDYNQHSGRLS